MQVAKSVQLEIHFLKGKSLYVPGLPPKVPDNQRIRFSGKTPFVPDIVASQAKIVKFLAHLTYKGETCPNAHLAAFNNDIDMNTHINAS